MKKLFLILLALQSCYSVDYMVIYKKSVIMANPNFSMYSYRVLSGSGVEVVQFIDSTTKYQVGDNLIK